MKAELPRTLCIGVDVTWWGGGRQPASRFETIISATLNPLVLHPIERVALSERPNPERASSTEPNFDADGEMLCDRILRIVRLHPEVHEVVIGLDAPLECLFRPEQPPRRKTAARGETTGSKQRAAERILHAYSRALDPQIGATWNYDLRIQAGSPIPCRIARVVERLRRCGFPPYRAVAGSTPRGVVEIFPSEAIWALGLLGAYGDDDSSTVRAYKTKKPRTLALSEAHAVARRPLRGFLGVLQAAGLPSDTTSAWIDVIANDAVALAIARDGQVRKSKSFDDPIDSGIAFFTTIACALGHFHEWGDGTDGTIVGPGRLPRRDTNRA